MGKEVTIKLENGTFDKSSKKLLFSSSTFNSLYREILSFFYTLQKLHKAVSI